MYRNIRDMRGVVPVLTAEATRLCIETSGAGTIPVHDVSLLYRPGGI